MRSTWRLLPIALGLVVPGVTGAQGKAGVCSLLTVKELTDAVGMAVDEGKENNTVIPSGPSKGETMRGCMWRVGDKSMVSVSMIAARGSASDKAAAIARLNQVFDRLKAKGWTRQRESFGSYACSLMTPPSTEPSMPNMTGCMGEAKGQGISVGFSSGTTKLPIGKVKTLFDKATARID